MEMHGILLILGAACAALGLVAAYSAYPSKRASNRVRHTICDGLTHCGRKAPRKGLRR